MGLFPTLSWASIADSEFAETAVPIRLQLAVAKVLSPISSGKPYDKNQVEQALLALGPASIEAIVAYLTHPNDDVKALASMVLVRFGQQAIPAVRRFYQQAQVLPTHAPERWVAHQLMHLLCVQPEPLVEVSLPVLTQGVPA
jgi:HEAT repeat protein